MQEERVMLMALLAIVLLAGSLELCLETPGAALTLHNERGVLEPLELEGRAWDAL